MATSTGSTSNDWQDWIGRSEQRHDMLTPAVAAALAATLDHDATEPALGAELPPLAHWLLFPALARESALGADGHARGAGLLPPSPLPRRMWAGGRLQFHRPLRIGDHLSRLSRILAITSKRGRSGTLLFITVCHEVSDAKGIALSEEQDIVFRDAPAAGEASSPVTSPAPPAQFERIIVPDPVLLFRYSALTFNAHRIHYDMPYATHHEGYRGLVVHGPLIATLLLDLLLRRLPGARVRRFSFRAQQPLFAGEAFALCGNFSDAQRLAELWTRAPDGQVTMHAQAELS